MIVDTSALLAVLFHEEAGPWVKDQMLENAFSLKMSTVNLAETLILLQSRQPHLYEDIREQVISSSIRFIAPTVSQAKIAAESRMIFPINLGDCFAYALAKEEQLPILTLDMDFKKTDLRVIMP
jgi:Uncharacterized protein conserved in bacteria